MNKYFKQQVLELSAKDKRILFEALVKERAEELQNVSKRTILTDFDVYACMRHNVPVHLVNADDYSEGDHRYTRNSTFTIDKIRDSDIDITDDRYDCLYDIQSENLYVKPNKK